LSTVMGWEPRGSCAIFACDVVSFGDPARTDVAKRYVRDGLYRGLRDSFDSVGIGFDACYREDRGDGALLALPPATDMSVLLGALIHRLRAEVRRHNEVSSSSAQMRLRLAVHTGEVQWDGNGLVGTAVDHAFRILEAAPFKEAVTSSEAMVALIVSERVYGDVVRHGRGDVDPSDFWQVSVSVKETRTTAWMMAPGLRLAPMRDAPAADLALDGARPTRDAQGPPARTMFSLFARAALRIAGDHADVREASGTSPLARERWLRARCPGHAPTRTR